MLSIFKKLFGKSESVAIAPVPEPVPQQPVTPMPAVEVAHLALAAIVDRFPEELKPTVLRVPDAAATVALPLPTILKQLPAANVKMSLASLHRQAPGVFQPLAPGDKRMIDVPLAEVFRHVRPHMLKRRPDQRPFVLPENTISLFGDPKNPRALAPTAVEEEPPEPTVLDLTPEMPRVLKMDAGLREHFNKTAERSMLVATAPPAAPEFKLTAPSDAPRVIAPPPEFNGADSANHSPAVPFPPPTNGHSLTLKLTPLAESWPEEIRAEVAALDPATTVALSAGDVSAGLAKGRVAFSWGQIRASLEPQPSSPTAAAEDTALVLPLKIVAPAFLASNSKPAAERKRQFVDESIPALFNNGSTPTVADILAESAEASVIPSTESTESVEPVAKHDPNRAPSSVGELFGLPHKHEWTPAEIVAHLVRLPGIAGAVVGLQEGLQVATSMPDGVKGEVVAAFLPQIFARLNQYAGEMKLGEVDDLLFTTHGAHCQIYRLGYIYFAVLGKPGETLPWHELRLIAAELMRQTNK